MQVRKDARRGRPKGGKPGGFVAQPQLIPVTLRNPDVLTARESRLSSEAVDTFARVVGGRDGLLDALAVAHAAPEIEHIVNLLLDPRYEAWSLKQLCEASGLTVADLFLAYRKASIVRAHIEAAHVIARHLPPIVEDVMRRATPQVLICPDCDGDAARKILCRTCAATGQVLSEPDLDRQKLALELGQLLERKGGGIVVNQTVATGPTAIVAGGRGGTLVQLQQAIGELLYRPAKRLGAPIEEPGDEDPNDVDDPTPPEDEDEDEVPPEGVPDQGARQEPPAVTAPLTLEPDPAA